MAGFYGMDVEAVQGLARQLDAKSQEITNLANQLTTQLSSTDWKGPDADRFRTDWDSIHRPALNNVAQALDTAGTTANQNATEQLNTSTR